MTFNLRQSYVLKNKVTLFFCFYHCLYKIKGKDSHNLSVLVIIPVTSLRKMANELVIFFTASTVQERALLQIWHPTCMEMVVHNLHPLVNNAFISTLQQVCNQRNGN